MRLWHRRLAQHVSHAARCPPWRTTGAWRAGLHPRCGGHASSTGSRSSTGPPSTRSDALRPDRIGATSAVWTVRPPFSGTSASGSAAVAGLQLAIPSLTQQSAAGAHRRQAKLGYALAQLHGSRACEHTTSDRVRARSGVASVGRYGRARRDPLRLAPMCKSRASGFSVAAGSDRTYRHNLNPAP